MFQSRHIEGKGPIRDWTRMKQMIRGYFFPMDFEHLLYIQYQNCWQGLSTMGDYTEEFYRLCARNNLKETDSQLIARFIRGLLENIQDKLGLNSI